MKFSVWGMIFSILLSEGSIIFSVCGIMLAFLTVCGQNHILSEGVKNNIKMLEGGLTRGLTI